MSTPAEARDVLTKYAGELHGLSRKLAEVEQEFAPVQQEYENFLDEFETALWFRHETEGAKLPSEAMRVRLAHRAMKPELLGRYVGLTNQRQRLRKRISDVKVSVEAQRSILSALKAELEATS
jgi:hypothetical protein